MKKIKILLMIATILTIATLVGLGILQKYEDFAYDIFLSNSNENSNEVIIVSIDDESINKLGRFPWNRDVYAKVVDNLTEGGVAVIGFDIIFSEEQGNQDEILKDAIKKTDSVVLAGNAKFAGDVREDNNTLVSEYMYYPNDVLMQANPTVGFINTIIDKDNIVRRGLTHIYDEETEQYKQSLNYNVYKKYAQQNNLDLEYIDYSFFERPYINFIGEAGSIETIPFYKVLEADEISPYYFENKIVLIGMTASGGQDIYYTPAGSMYGVEINANYINNLILGNYKKSFLADIIYYMGNGIYLSPILVLSVVLVGLVYILIVLRVDSSVKKTNITIISILLYLLLEYIMIKFGYLIIIVYPLITILTLYSIDVVFDLFITKKEKNIITNLAHRYLSKDVINEVVDKEDGVVKLGGYKRDITVMFIDIRGFTTISESLEAEKVVEILNKYLTIATEQIINNKGMLDKYIGDGVMAIFNAPTKVENPELMCIQAALDIRDKFQEFKKYIKETYDIEIDYGIGINCGQAIVGNIGSELRMDFTAVGDAVNTAARLETSAKPGEILISEHVYERVKNEITAEYVGEFQYKGKKILIKTYKIS